MTKELKQAAFPIPETWAIPNYPRQEVREFGERVSMAMYDASIRHSMAGLGGCKDFQIEDFDEDVRPYILAYLEGNYDSVAITYAAMRTKEQQESSYKELYLTAPVAWSGWGCQYPGKMPRLYGERRIAELNCDWENGDQVLYFTAASQPAEQQPSPDVAALVEALELMVTTHEEGGWPTAAITIARAALAAQQGGVK